MPDPIPAVKAAEWFLTQGFRAFPVWSVTDHGTCRCPLGPACTSPGKHPATGKGGFHDATDDIERVKTFLSNPGTSNYGLVPPKGVIAVDVDGEDGKAKWDELQKQHGPLPATLTVVTANGWHFFFAVDDERIGKHLFGFITRSQDKGYTLGPGSHHASGVTYGMVNGKGGIQPLPEKWVVGLTKPKTSNLSNATIKVGGPPDPASIPEGSRHDYLRDRARTLRGGGLTGEALLNAVMALNAQLPSPKTQEEVERAIGDVETKFDADPMDLPVTEEAVAEVESDFPQVINAATAVPPADIDDWLVTDLLRPRQLAVLASTEGVGKSNIRLELGIRYACGYGALFDTYAMGRAGNVLVFDEENGPREEWEREEAMLASLGLTRATHLVLYDRIHYSGLDLENAVHREFFDRLLTDRAPQLVILDTAGAMVGEEHGKDFKKVIAFLKAMKEKHDCAIVLVVHLVKPPRDGKTAGKALERTITDVMGQWTRSADVLMLVSETDDDEVILFRVRKRVTRSDITLKRDTPDAPDRWARVDAKRMPPTMVAKEEHANILVAISEGRSTWEQVTGYLSANELPVPSRRTMFRHLSTMAESGLIARDPTGVITLTDLGRASVPARVSLVLDRPGASASTNPPTGGGGTGGTGNGTGTDTV